MRLAHRIYSLHLQIKDDVVYTYQRVFKYLLEQLPNKEFEQLSFISVNRLIDTIFQTKFQSKVPSSKRTLKQFIYDGLDLQYKQSDQSTRLLHPDDNIKHYFAKSLWTSCKDIRPGKEYENKTFDKIQIKSKHEVCS